MDIDKKETIVMPVFPLGGPQKTNVWDTETAHLTVNHPISPEFAKLMQHREQVANQETNLLQAATLPIRQEKGEPGPATKETQAKQEQTARKLFRRKPRVPILQ